MAAFCTKCGAPLSSSTGFCSSCGTSIAPATAAIPPVGPVQAAPPVAAYGQQAVPPVAGYPMAPPPQSSNSALKIVLIVVAVVVGLGILGAGAMGFMAWHVAKTMKVDSSGQGVTMTVPGGGTISAGDSVASDVDLGVPAYPGALREKGGVNMDTASASMVMAHFATNDSISQVTDFYKGKMGETTVAVTSGDGTVLNSGSDADKVMVTIGPGNGDDAGKTTIVIMHTKKKQS